MLDDESSPFLPVFPVLVELNFRLRLSHFFAFSMIPFVRMLSHRWSMPNEPKSLARLSSSWQLSQMCRF
jgi:hypothetical protein